MTNGLTSEQLTLIEMLEAELAGQPKELGGDADALALYEFLQEAAQTLDSLANAAALLELHALANHWRWLHSNFLGVAEQLLAAGQQPEKALQSYLARWSGIYQVLLALFKSERKEETFTKFQNSFSQFCLSHYLISPLTSDECQSQLEQMFSSNIVHVESSSNIPKVANASLMSMTLSDSINPELMDGLMVELPNQVKQFAEALDIYTKAGAISVRKEALLVAQRIAHTVKGAANVVGISGLANFMHYSEDLLEEIGKHNQEPTADLCQLCMDVSDTLANLSDALVEGDTSGKVVGEWEIGVMQAVLDAFHVIHQNGIGGNLAPREQRNKRIDTESIASEVSLEPEVVNVAEPAEAAQVHLRIKETTAQDLLRLAGENAIFNNQLQTQVGDLKGQLQHIHQLHAKLAQITEEFGHLIEVKELFSAKQKSASNSELDPLELDRYNELHSFFHQLQEFATDAQDAIGQAQQQTRGLVELGHQQNTTNRLTQNHLLDMRMIPVYQLEARFQRCVRQAARMTQKQVEFMLTGGETLIDSRLLHDMVDPIMHLLRNAVDHAFPVTELASTAKIELAFSLRSQFIVIQVIDNGLGLQTEQIQRKAEALGLTPPAHASEENIAAWVKQLIFSPGFSTRDSVTQTSGRGIGLDVVADRVAQLKGRVTVESEPNLGCQFTIRLPMAMIAEQALLVKQGAHSLVIAARGVEQLLFVDSALLKQRDDRWYYQLNQQELELVGLQYLAPMPNTSLLRPQEAQSLLLVEALPGQFLGVLVERVITSREMVVKPLNQYNLVVSGVVGACILGDGAVAPVLDVQQLVLDYWQRGFNWKTNIEQLAAQSLQQHQSSVLIVDDSLSTRKSLAQFVGDMGLQVTTAKDGFEAVEVMQEHKPDLILVDMEMPRMNGLELAAHVRSRPDWAQIPIIMITSRNTEKHRQLAKSAGVDTYLTKPFSEDELIQEIQRRLPSESSVIKMNEAVGLVEVNG